LNKDEARDHLIDKICANLDKIYENPIIVENHSKKEDYDNVKDASAEEVNAYKDEDIKDAYNGWIEKNAIELDYKLEQKFDIKKNVARENAYGKAKKVPLHKPPVKFTKKREIA
jgi:hypothetical protein